MEARTCHGCSGKGWIELSIGKAQVCPVCLGSGQITDGSAPTVPHLPQTIPYAPWWPTIPYSTPPEVTWYPGGPIYGGCSMTSKPIYDIS